MASATGIGSISRGDNRSVIRGGLRNRRRRSQESGEGQQNDKNLIFHPSPKPLGYFRTSATPYAGQPARAAENLYGLNILFDHDPRGQYRRCWLMSCVSAKVARDLTAIAEQHAVRLRRLVHISVQEGEGFSCAP